MISVFHHLQKDKQLKQRHLTMWERIWPVSCRSIFMLRTKVQKYLARYFRTVPTKSYLMAATTNWPQHGSNQQVYPRVGFSTVLRLVLPLPYASTGSTVCMHGKRSSNGSCPSLSPAPARLRGFAVSTRWAEFELATFTILWERIWPVSCRSVFMLRTKVRKYLARYIQTLVRSHGINMLR